MTLQLLSKPSCVQCKMTERTLDAKGAEYTEADLTQDAEALATAKGLGYMAAPVVLVRDAVGNLVDHWSGFRPEKIAQYA